MYVIRAGGKEAPRVLGLPDDWIDYCDRGGNASIDYSGHVFQIPGWPDRNGKPRGTPKDDAALPPEEGFARFSTPAGLAASAAELYITDEAAHRIAVYGRFGPEHRFGEFLRHFGRPGSNAGEFRRPRGIACDAGGRVYVADDLRVQLLLPDGTPLQVLAPPGAVQLGGLCVTEGHVVVADQGAHLLHVLTRCGAVVRQLRNRALTALQDPEPVDPEPAIGAKIAAMAAVATPMPTPTSMLLPTAPTERVAADAGDRVAGGEGVLV